MKFNLLAWCLVDVSDDKKNFRLGGTYQLLTGRASPEQRVAGLADQSTSSKRKQANRSATFVNRRHQRVYKSEGNSWAMKFNLLAWCLVDVSDDKKNFRLGGTYQVLTGRASPEQRVAGLADQSTSSKRKQANRSATFVNRRHQRVYKCSALETDIESNPGPGFNIYHQAAIRIAESKREEAARENGKQCGIRWSYLPGNRFPPQRRGQQNSDASQKIFTLSLFADDTTVIGHNDEVEEGKRIVERCLLEFEEQTNLDKEEKMVFGDEKNNTELRMLGTWMENNNDTTKRIQRAGKNWATIKRRFLKCRLTKRTQAKVVEACIESTMLFNASVRPFKLKEIKRMQTFMDKRYRYIWSDKNGQPLRQMEEKHLNMADIREQLNVTSLRTKIDKAHLLRMGHVLRMNDDRLVKQAVLGWYSKLEEENKTKKLPHRNIITYWRKLINEAGEDPNNIEHLITDRTKWRALVRNRVKHLEEYERQQGHNHVIQPDEIIRDRRESTKTPTENTLQCEICDKVCRSKAGLAIHRKRLHDSQQKETQCEKCGKTFTQGATLKNHMKKCSKHHRKTCLQLENMSRRKESA